MSIRPHVAKCYKVEYDEIYFLTADEFIDIVKYMQNNFGTDIVSWINSDEDSIEFYVPELEKLLNFDLSKDSKMYKLVKYLLEKYDKNNDFIRVDLF